MPGFDFDAGDMAERYDRGRELPSETLALWMDEVARELPIAARRLLDLGCGTGRFLAPLAGRFPMLVCGVDLSRRMLSVARNSAAPVVQAPAESLPFADGAFDLVFLSMVLHHIQDSPRAVAELARVVRPGGILFVRTPTLECTDSYLWMRFFPEAAAIEASRVPAAAAIAARLPGFDLLRRRTIRQLFAADPRDYYRKLAERTLSSLRAIPDAAFAAGLAALDRHCAAALPGPVFEQVELLVFERRSAA
jgi:ubiquinone/menaquinone biosynthesis C-methylase UbiE